MQTVFRTYFYSLLLIVFTATPAFAQQESPNAEMSVFFELFGMNKYASCNADIALSRFVVMRLGVGYIGVPFGLSLVLPFGETVGGRSDSNIEFGAGFAIPLFDDIDMTTTNLTLAYRYVPVKGGFTYRAGITFLFETTHSTTSETKEGWFIWHFRYNIIESHSATSMYLYPSLSIGYAF